MAMNAEGIFTADIACELVTQKIKQCQLDYDIQETPATAVIVIRKRFIEDKIEVRTHATLQNPVKYVLQEIKRR